MKVADVLAIPDKAVLQFHELKRPLIDMAFSLDSSMSIGKVTDPVTTQIKARHKLSYTPAFQWPHNTVRLYVLEYLGAPFMILATKEDREYGWSALHARIHVLDWGVLHQLHSHFTLADPKFGDFLSVPDDGDVEVGIGACRVALTSSGYRFVPSDWLKKAAGSITDDLVFDDSLLRFTEALDSEASIIAAVLPALKAPNFVDVHKFRRLFYGYTAFVFENDGRAFLLDCIFPNYSPEFSKVLEPVKPESLSSCIRITELGPATILASAQSFAETGAVPSDDEFVQAVSTDLGLSISQAQEIVTLMMTRDDDLFGAFGFWCREVNPAFLQGEDFEDFKSEAIVGNPGVLDLLPSGRYSLDEAREQVEFNREQLENVAISKSKATKTRRDKASA